MKVRKYEASLSDISGQKQVFDHLTVEHPLSIFVNGEIWTLTMQTPGDEYDLVRGLLFAEGIYKRQEGRPEYEAGKVSEDGWISEIRVKIPEHDLNRSEITRRSLLSAASCGICGVTELKELKNIPRLKYDGEMITSSLIAALFSEMKKHQEAFDKSGGSHAASIFGRDGKLLVIREDIGRHNAVDKCVGALLHRGELKKAAILLVSGRVSYEIITKCFTAGIPFLAAVSAPSSLAVDFAKELGITLFGFCREGRATRYS